VENEDQRAALLCSDCRKMHRRSARYDHRRATRTPDLLTLGSFQTLMGRKGTIRLQLDPDKIAPRLPPLDAPANSAISRQSVGGLGTLRLVANKNGVIWESLLLPQGGHSRRSTRGGKTLVAR